MGTAIGYIIGFLILGGIIAIYIMRYYNTNILPAKNKELENSTSMFATFEKGELHIKQRSPELSKVVRIENDVDAVVKYEPPKLHIGAATVGGVTTGGAYTTGGYKYMAGTEKNGKYKLTYLGSTIFEISMPSDLSVEEIR